MKIKDILKEENDFDIDHYIIDVYTIHPFEKVGQESFPIDVPISRDTILEMYIIPEYQKRLNKTQLPFMDVVYEDEEVLAQVVIDVDAIHSSNMSDNYDFDPRYAMLYVIRDENAELSTGLLKQIHDKTLETFEEIVDETSNY